MNFGMDYYNLLTGGISSTNRLLEQYGTGKLRRANSGNGIQKSNRAFNSINTGTAYGSLQKLAMQNNSKMLDGSLKADVDNLKQVFGSNGSFGQNVRASAIVTQKTTSAQMMNQSRLSALSSGYGMSGLYNSLGGFGGLGLSSFFGNWFV